MMPEFNISDSIVASMNAQEPWPDNVKLFQPYEVEQILLPDNASCLAVQAFLKMCNLPFEVEMRWNAEFMSPSGRVPFIKCGAFVVSELEPIVQFAANKGVTLTSRLSTEEKAEMRAYMSLITNVLVNAELYISWIDNETYNAVTKVRNSSVYPWPLGWIQTRSKRNAVIKRLKALHWSEKTLEQVLSDVEQCCNSLSQRLGDRDFFFGSPCPLDALMYGHTRALLSAAGPKAPLLIKPITSSLLRHLRRMTNLTKMGLTPQEEYLVTQAFNLTKRRLSPERRISDKSTRIKKSKLSVRNSNSRDMLLHAAQRDVFGFKPFASKQIIIMTSNEGNINITSAREGERYIDYAIDEERYSFVIEALEEVLRKVEELTEEKSDSLENHDFEVIVYPTNLPKLDTVDKPGDCLDVIDETEIIDIENVIKIIEEDSDATLKNKISRETIPNDVEKCGLNDFDSSMSENKILKEDTEPSVRVSSFSSVSQFSTESKSSIKAASSEDISVQSFMKRLRTPTFNPTINALHIDSKEYVTIIH